MIASRSLKRSAKELIRHSLFKCGLGSVHLLARRASGQNLDHLRPVDAVERFRAVYLNGTWLGGTESFSGLGSSLAATQTLRATLPRALQALHVRTLLDLGCGDFHWMKEVKLPCDYIGADIVPELIVQNTQKYAQSGREFRVVDAITEELPSVDAILCREVLFHLSFADIRRVIQAVKCSGARLLLATNDEGLRFNADILTADFRLLNLRMSPFCFPQPVDVLPDDGVNSDRILGIWEVAQLP